MNKPAERIQKVLATQGLASRREIERWIEAGRIKLNGRPAKLGDCYSPGDKLSIDDKPVHFKSASSQPNLGLMYYKPEGEVTTRSDEQGRKTIFDNLPECGSGRWINVGRLDLNTSGLMLLVNNGELANRLMHPKYRMLRHYAVRVLGEVSDDQIQQMLKGVTLEDGQASFESILDAGGKGSNHWYHVSLREGRNREVRRLWESQGIRVSRLIRIQYGPIKLDSLLKAGRFRPLKDSELNQLFNEVGMPVIKPRRVGKKTTPRRENSKKTDKAETEGPWSQKAGKGRSMPRQPAPDSKSKSRRVEAGRSAPKRAVSRGAASKGPARGRKARP